MWSSVRFDSRKLAGSKSSPSASLDSKVEFIFANAVACTHWNKNIRSKCICPNIQYEAMRARMSDILACRICIQWSWETAVLIRKVVNFILSNFHQNKCVDYLVTKKEAHLVHGWASSVYLSCSHAAWGLWVWPLNWNGCRAVLLNTMALTTYILC